MFNIYWRQRNLYADVLPIVSSGTIVYNNPPTNLWTALSNVPVKAFHSKAFNSKLGTVPILTRTLGILPKFRVCSHRKTHPALYSHRRPRPAPRRKKNDDMERELAESPQVQSHSVHDRLIIFVHGVRCVLVDVLASQTGM